MPVSGIAYNLKPNVLLQNSAIFEMIMKKCEIFWWMLLLLVFCVVFLCLLA